MPRFSPPRGDLNMIRKYCALLMVIFLAGVLQPGTLNAQNSAPGPSTKAAWVLEDSTPVRLRISRTISSADAKTGDTVDFEVLDEIKIGDAIVVPKSGLALGTVTEAE